MFIWLLFFRSSRRVTYKSLCGFYIIMLLLQHTHIHVCSFEKRLGLDAEKFYSIYLSLHTEKKGLKIVNNKYKIHAWANKSQSAERNTIDSRRKIKINSDLFVNERCLPCNKEGSATTWCCLPLSNSSCMMIVDQWWMSLCMCVKAISFLFW